MPIRYGPENPDETYVAHSYPEQMVDLGEVRMNYVAAGPDDAPPLLLIPGQTESWWGYEAAIPLLTPHFRVYAVDLRGQGRSSRTPGRYTLDNMGNDLVRFIALVIGRPVVVSGLSSGGVLSAWLSAYAMPGTIRGALYEDPPLFTSELHPAYGPSVRQSVVGPLLALWNKYLGDQWSIGDWEGMVRNARNELPPNHPAGGMTARAPSQMLKEYDPEWGRAFWTGTVGASCDHAAMLRSVKVPVLLTHHTRKVDEATGTLMSALSDMQAQRVRDLIIEAGQRCDYQSFPQMGHSMHGQDPQRYAKTLLEWAATLSEA